jgi:hypothetical protein
LSRDARAALPNLIVIGAGKCGTSALHHYLAQHPEIGMSEPKELHLFGGPRWLERLPGYAAHFDAAKAVRGESSPDYSMDPHVPCVPEQMAAVLPQPRFVYLVADPIRRVVAHWAEQRVVRNDLRDLSEALADADDPTNPYVAGSRFGHQLQRYVDVFGAERVLVVDQRDLRERRAETLREVFAFAGVDPEHRSPEFDVEVNAARSKLVPNRLGDWLLHRLAPRRPDLAKRAGLIRGVTARRLGRPELDAATRARLADALGPDIAHFRALTGRAFSDWEI